MIHEQDYVKSLLKKHFERTIAPTELLLLQDAFLLYEEAEMKSMIDEMIVAMLPGTAPPQVNWEAFVAEEMKRLKQKASG
ncbi:hypothetical protein [Parasegetibacter sp. NRK P23]|uniref:hypothetical protein n=1 Tax=Parasegetibacter sp. NRK P23 TaxID=2942999 RepID=UPI002043C7CC|nr:hypothetical protein [Parasegetibacter sp. NRK P23]MCM5529803.1 hypothetical protein [Parasegetibacter sp. NRK P23]